MWLLLVTLPFLRRRAHIIAQEGVHEPVDGFALALGRGFNIDFRPMESTTRRLYFHHPQIAGNEYSVVVIPIRMTHFVMLERNLIYTGITRAKKLLVLIGSLMALSYAIRNNNILVGTQG